MSPLTPADLAGDILESIDPPAGRADLSITQRIAMAQVYATLELAEQQRAANVLVALGSSSLIEEDEGKRATSDVTRYRVQYRNDMRRDVQSVVHHTIVLPRGDGE